MAETSSVAVSGAVARCDFAVRIMVNWVEERVAYLLQQ
jgi:hypothetical protein